MIIKRLELCNFRNYEEQSFEFDEKLNIIYGSNAQGKTNILEGIYLFSMGKSNRASKDSEMIKFGSNFASLGIEFISKKAKTEGKIDLDLRKNKRVFINDIPIKKNSELLGRLNAVFFGPEYMFLIKDGPKKRRKNIDITISQLRPKYLAAVSDYKKLIEQKNSLLKNDRIDESLLEVINERIIAFSEYIINMRYEYIKKTEALAKKIQLEISDGKEELELRYISCGKEIKNDNIDKVVRIVRKSMVELKERELRYRESICGPHRDDIEFLINGKNIKGFGSQGQQKTAVLVQKIAEAELFKEETGEYPVLLLDDIMSEFDEKRQDYILNKIKNMQIFVTCTDTKSYKNIKKGKFFKIEKGRIEECTCI